MDKGTNGPEVLQSRDGTVVLRSLGLQVASDQGDLLLSVRRLHQSNPAEVG